MNTQPIVNKETGMPTVDYATWDTKMLVEHIVGTHHVNIRKTMPELLGLGAVVSALEAERHPETREIYERLLQLDNCMRQHITSVEYALFPYILEMENVYFSKLPFVAPAFGRVEKPIRIIENEHNRCADLLKDIRMLSAEFVAPLDASAEHLQWYALLRAFDADMRLHYHLECNILFPRAIAQETALLERKGFTSIWFG
ncbi:MAG: hemerythrin domain-containing protein [Saprospiraceae bacterium]|nr:hemerythrin domain-containing protein [Saprospiraceae bacterium]